MAEKEERISVIVYEKDPCENCPGKPMTDCQVCEKDLRYDGAMTRTEAIEKMAKAMIKRYNSERTLTKWEKEWNKKHPKEAYKYFYIDAEKALNSLLEGE